MDMELELCTCPVGHSGAPCKHQAAVVQNYSITSINFLPTTAEMKAELLKMTKGNYFFAESLVTHGLTLVFKYLKKVFKDNVRFIFFTASVSLDFLNPLRQDMPKPGKKVGHRTFIIHA